MFGLIIYIGAARMFISSASLLKFPLLVVFIRTGLEQTGLRKGSIIRPFDSRKPSPRKSLYQIFACDTYKCRRVPFFSGSLKYSEFPHQVESNIPHHL